MKIGRLRAARTRGEAGLQCPRERAFLVGADMPAVTDHSAARIAVKVRVTFWSAMRRTKYCPLRIKTYCQCGNEFIGRNVYFGDG